MSMAEDRLTDATIIDFYQGTGTNADGQTFHECLQMSDAAWEKGHLFIQWLFPLPEPSHMQPSSPVATQDDYNIISTTPVLKMRVLAALGRYIAFLDRTTQWRRQGDHNHQRITRVIRCLCFVGWNDPAYDFCEHVKEQIGGTGAGTRTMWFWDEALKRHPAWLDET